MTELPIPPNHGVHKTGSTGPAEGAKKPAATKEQGAAFRALLEQLDEKARALQAQTQGVDDAANLAGAVEGAKASLDQALSLGEELLESYRQTRQQNPNVPEEESK